MNNIQLSSNLRINQPNSNDKRKNEYMFESTPGDKRILKNKNSKSNQQLQTRSSNDQSNQNNLSLTQQLQISKIQAGQVAAPDSSRKSAKFTVGGQFRGKNTKRPSGQNQQIQIQSTQQAQGYLRLANQPQTTTNANRQPIFAASIQTMQTLQQQQQRMNSQPSQKSLRSQGSTEAMTYATQDNQYRRRLVALAQAQQQQILAVHQANSQKNTQRMWPDGNRRQSNDNQDNDSDTVGAGVKILSKKMISFRTQTKSQEKNKKGGQGEQYDRMAEMRNQQPTVKSVENNRLNHTQGFKINLQENNANSTRPNVDDSINKNSSANVSNSHFKGYNPNSQAASNKSPEEQTPRQSNETYGGNMVSDSIQSNVGSASNSRDNKVTRVISGNPQRRLQQPNHGGGTIASSKGSNATGTTEAAQSAASAAQHALQAYNRRRNPQGPPEQPVRNGLFVASNSLISSKRSGNELCPNQVSQKALQTLNAGSTDDEGRLQFNEIVQTIHKNNVQNAAMNTIDQKRPQAGLTKKGGNNVMSAPGEKVDEAHKILKTGVIYHPHPLNQNIDSIAGGPSQTGVDSARPHSEKYDMQGGMNNRNSRKTLKPLGNKKKSQNINLAHTQKSLKTVQNTQYQQINHQIVELSTSRERLAHQQILMGQNYSTSQPQILLQGSASQIQSSVSTTTNMANKNVMFKFKKNSQTNRGQPAVTSYDTNQLSNTARRPIMIRKNNYVIQQSAPQHPMRTINEASNPRQRPSGGILTGDSLNQNSASVGGRKKTINSQNNGMIQPQALQFSNSDKKQQSKFKNTGTVAFESGLGEIASLAGLPGFENFVFDSQTNNMDLTGPQMELLKSQLLKMNETPDSRDNQIKQQAQTQRAMQSSTTKKEQSDIKTVLASLTAAFNTNKQPQHQHQALGQTVSQGSLQVNNVSSNQKLIKINKSKKMLDTARRSRIQQLDKDNYNTSGIQGMNQLNLIALNSNGAPPFTGNQKMQIKQQTNQGSNNKQLISLNIPDQSNFNTTQKTGDDKQSMIKNQENNYLSLNNKSGSNNKNTMLQLNMNINTKEPQTTAKQQMSSSDGMQQRKNSKKLDNFKPNMKELPTSQLPLALQSLQSTNKGITQNVNLNLAGIQNSARNMGGANHQGINVQEAQAQAANTQRFTSNADQQSSRQQKPGVEQLTENQIQIGSNQKPYRRGQIYKKQQNKNLQESNSVEDLQSLSSIQVVKNIIETKESNGIYESAAQLQKKSNPAVKIENQLSHQKNSNRNVEPSEEEKQTLPFYQADLDGIQDEHSLGETDPEFTNQMKQVIQEIENKSKTEQTEQAENNLNKPSLLNEISEEDLVLDADQTEDEPQNKSKTKEDKKNYNQTQLVLQQKNSLASATKKVLQIHNKITDQRTTTDTNPNSQRKQTNDTQGTTGRVNINTSIVNQPRGLINTAFSLSSVASRDEMPEFPTTPQNILRYYINELSDYEKGEILDFDMIYFLGSKEKKVDGVHQTTLQQQSTSEKNKDLTDSSKQQSSKSSSKEEKETKENYNHNYGYDDDKGDYKIVMGDHIGYRYEIVEFLGKGSFGTALRCIDHKEKKNIAVKIVKNKKKYYYQASVELKILQYLKQHDVEDIMNVVHIYDYVVFRKHLCMGFELLSMNLFEFLKINDFNGFDHNLIRRFAIQLLYALKYLKQLEIIHCDLKPENILLKEENKSGIKIIDFGSSTFIDEKVYTYIQSRFYRAPEIMLGIPYTPAIDMWSLGCIMAELYIGYPIFPGDSENDQMSRIMEMRDAPNAEVLKMSERKMKFFTQNKENKKLEPIMLKNSRGKLRKPNGKPLDYVIGDEDPDFNDFVIKCLDWNPNTRLSPDDALKHVWVLKGLPPQVLIHHQKMHNIATPELPEIVKVARDEFLIDQHKEQQLIQQQQQRITNSQKQQQKDLKRDISHNPEGPRPHVQLKTPRTAQKPAQLQTAFVAPANGSYPTSAKGDAPKIVLSNVNKKLTNQPQQTQSSKQSSNDGQSQGNTRRKFAVVKKQ